MLNKNEYLDILDFLSFFYGTNLIATAELRAKKTKELQKEDELNFFKKINKLNELVNEYFDNPPLKFDELEINNPYFDTNYNSWCLIESKEPFVTVYSDETIDREEPFAENRFYRKRVKNVHQKK